MPPTAIICMAQDPHQSFCYGRRILGTETNLLSVQLNPLEGGVQNEIFRKFRNNDYNELFDNHYLLLDEHYKDDVENMLIDIIANIAFIKTLIKLKVEY